MNSAIKSRIFPRRSRSDPAESKTLAIPVNGWLEEQSTQPEPAEDGGCHEDAERQREVETIKESDRQRSRHPRPGVSDAGFEHPGGRYRTHRMEQPQDTKNE